MTGPAAAGGIRRLWGKLRRSCTSLCRRAAGPDVSAATAARNRRMVLAVQRQLRGLQAGDRASPFRGSGLEALQVRPYAPGEPVRQVDWRITARRGDLHVRSHGEDREVPVVLVVSPDEVGDTALAGEPGARILEACTWLAYAASVAGHPLGVRTFGSAGGSWLPPGRGRETLRHVLAAVRSRASARRGTEARTLAQALESVSDRVAGEGLVLAVSTFTFAPSAQEGLRRAVSRLVRRHPVIPIWVDPVAELPRAGLLHVREPGGRRHVVDTASTRVRSTYDRATSAWREGVAEVLAPCERPPVRIRPTDRVETVLGQAFSPRRRPRRTRNRRGHPPRAMRRVGAVGWLTLAGLASGLSAQSGPEPSVLPGQIRIVGDTLLAAPVLGTEVVRVTQLVATPGAAVTWDGGLGAAWETLSGELAPSPTDAPGGPAGPWTLTTRLIPWWMGDQALPGIRLRLEDAAGPRTIRLPSGRVRIGEAVAPWPGAGITRPEPGPPGPIRHLALGPGALFVLAAALGVTLWVVQARSGMRAASPGPLRPLSLGGESPRTDLHRVMARLRRYARERHGLHPDGWTAREWARWQGTLGGERAALVEAVVRKADGPRFRRQEPDEGASREAVAALNRLLALPAQGQDGEVAS